jgi:hypothetical protein
LTSDRYVLDSVSGCKLEFIADPPVGGLPNKETLNASKEQGQIIEQEVQDLLSKQAIDPTNKDTDQVISRLFVVPKQDGKWLAVLNLKPLNAFIEKQNFEMGNWGTRCSLLHQGDYMVRLDLKDAFLSIPIYRDYIRFLCFDLKGPGMHGIVYHLGYPLQGFSPR